MIPRLRQEQLGWREGPCLEEKKIVGRLRRDDVVIIRCENERGGSRGCDDQSPAWGSDKATDRATWKNLN